MTMLDNMIENLDSIRDNVGYIVSCLIALRDIWAAGGCNECFWHCRCIYEPKIGEMVRYNCPRFKKAEDKDGQQN